MRHYFHKLAYKEFEFERIFHFYLKTSELFWLPSSEIFTRDHHLYTEIPYKTPLSLQYYFLLKMNLSFVLFLKDLADFWMSIQVCFQVQAMPVLKLRNKCL